MRSRPSVIKRKRERERQEKRQAKAEKRAQRQHDSKDARGVNGEDPDIAGIVPGPQLIPGVDDELEEEQPTEEEEQT